MRYKVGDKVDVKQGLKHGDQLGCDRFIDDMMPYKMVTITEIRFGIEKYRVNENSFNYTDEMLDGLHFDNFDVDL